MANEHQVITPGKVVTLHYTLTNAAGEVLDTSQGDEPLDYLHGHANIVEGLEEALAGKSVGERVNVTVSPEKGYGLRNEDDVQPVPRNMFPDDEEIVPGMEFVTRDEDGNPLPVWVSAVDAETVTVDLNHPLAGEELHFDVEVVGVREASAEELEHGHPHGADGHHHHDE